MYFRSFIIIAVVLLLAIVVLALGMLRANAENKAIIAKHIVKPSQVRTFDLRPHVYAGLPAPVRRYFDYAFNGREEVKVDWTEWTESGNFLLPVGRFRSSGWQVNRADEPIYAWTGKFAKAGIPLIESRDAFFLDKHNMRAKLFGWLKVMHTDYQDDAEIASLHSYLVLRYYGQSPLMPWAMLPNPYVKWVANDDTSAYLEVSIDGLASRYLVTFGTDGRIDSMATDRLLMEGNHTMQQEVGRKLDYENINGFMIPTRMDYRWTLEDGSLVSHYAFKVDSVKYLH
jgi:hypothetical protein